ncbi:MAG: hypothetical protein [Wendovervirus sonii]|uniref:Uncharacterized protein n=1 Tax=phage Lak_Megaphage_Sonny TaxID=3109229 RepID=A0ABZ0Z2Z5_9CAUD|nr:MAG: hypothetical protein [phage Lak_Megaphage_Sonny]
MGAFFAKQLNGNFCKVSTSADNFSEWEVDKDDMETYFISTDYNYCRTISEMKDDSAIIKMEEEMENPPEKGKFISSFEEALVNLTMSNYKSIYALRDQLRMMGYDKWKTFMTWDFLAGVEIRKCLKDHFDEIKDELIEYLMPDENSVLDCLSDSMKQDSINFKNNHKEAINKIQTFDDFCGYLMDMWNKNDDDINMECFYMSADIKSLEKYIDRKEINDKFNAQFENHSYIEVV